MKALKRAMLAVLSAVLGCCFFVGCLSTKMEVTYVVDGEVYRVQEYDMDTQIALPTAPTKEGHMFIGWYTDEACTNPYTEGKITQGITLYAKFSVSTVYIVINANGGTVDNRMVEVVPGSDYTVSEPTKEGYTFIGYTYIDGNGDEQPFPLTGKYPSDANIAITAQYEINKYTVTFIDSGAETETSVDHGSVVAAPATAKEGYTFDGWYTEANEKFDFSTAVKSDLTLTARYTANNYTITVALNGGAFENEADATVSVQYDSAYALAEPTRAGYTFAGYTVDGIPFDTAGTYTRANNIVVTANWTKDAYTVTFKDFDTDTEISVVEGIEYNASITAPAAVAGYEFVAAYQADKTTVFDFVNDKITASTVIYVKYQEKTFTIKVNGAQNGYVNPQVQYGATYTLETPDRGENYTFVGFTMNGEEFPASGTYIWTEDIIVTAVWEGNGKDIVFYNGNVEISRIESEAGADISTLDIPAVPELPGYSNDGKWYTDQSFSTAFVATGTLNDNINLYAKYTANHYQITVYGGETLDVIFDGEYSLPAMSKTGYIFNGYKVVGGDTFAQSGVYTVVGNTFVEPVWLDDSVVVNFYVDGVATSVNALRGLTVNAIANPEKVGHTFNGWYTSQNNQTADTKFDFSTALTEDNTNLYAGFTANTYTVVFQVWDNALKAMKDVNVTVVYGGMLTAPVQAVRESYNFDGYYANGERIDLNTPYTDLTITTVEERWTVKGDAAVWEDHADQLYFKERETIDDAWTFVYLAGADYTFADGTVLEVVGMGATASGNVLNVTSAGSFTLKVNGIERPVKVVEYVRSFTLGGTNYDAAWGLNAEGTDYKRNATDVWNRKVSIDAGETMKVGATNFIPELNINGGNLSIDKANVEIKVECDGADVPASLYTVNSGAINFDASLVGKTLSITIEPRYAVDATHTVQYNVVLNNGYNVYTDADMKAAIENTSVKEINVLRNITAVLDADGYVPGTTAPINGSDVNGGSAVYERLTGSLKLNGNYFTVDGSNLPIVDNRYDDRGFIDNSGAYVLMDVQFSIFSFGIRGANNYDTMTMDNLNIIGNVDRLDDPMAYTNYTENSKPVLKNSGACIGIQVGSGTLNLNNVTSRYGAFAANVYAADPMIKQDGSGYTHRSTMVATDCNFADSWSNNIYVWGFGSVTLDSCYIGASNGAAVHFDARPSETGVNGEWNVLNDTEIENWVIGTEAWFQAYNAVSAVNLIKTQVESAVSALGGLAGASRTVTNNETVNFVFLMKQTGDAEDWIPDPEGKGTVDVNFSSLDVLTAGGLLTKAQANTITAEEYAQLQSIVPDVMKKYAKFGAAGAAGFAYLEGYVEIINA